MCATVISNTVHNGLWQNSLYSHWLYRSVMCYILELSCYFTVELLEEANSNISQDEQTE